jgi:hypothetical protein
VETGEIVGSAKVDGAATELLALEDRVTGELVRSAGLKPPRPRPRARLRSWKTVELYGDAAVEVDPARKKEKLQLAIDEDPGFVYALRDLAALEQRLAGYSRESSARLATHDLKLSAVPRADRARAAQKWFAEAHAQRRWHAAASTAAALVEPAWGDEVREEATYRLFQARDQLHEVDLALQVGELYLAQFPTAARFREVETRMHELVETRKKRAARKAEYDADVADKRQSSSAVERDFAPCIAARWNNQLNQLMLDGCTAFLAHHANDTDPDAREHVLAARFFVVLALAETGDFARARPLADKLLADSDAWDTELQALLATFPTD